MNFNLALRKLALLVPALLLMTSCQPPPTIRIAEPVNPSEKMALVTEITKNLIADGFGYPIEMVKAAQGADLVGLMAEGKIDLALFVEDAAAKGIPSQCSEASKELAALGQSSESDLASKVVRCELSNIAKDLFDALAKIKYKDGDLDDALFWQEDNKATAKQSALYFLHNNQTRWKKWIPEEGIQNVKSAIAKEIEISKLQF